MKVNPKVKKLQEGGAAPAPTEQAQPQPEQGGAPQGGEQDPIMQLAQMAAEALQSNNCDAAMQVLQAFIELVQQASGSGAAPAEQQGAPVYSKKGGKIVVRRINK